VIFFKSVDHIHDNQPFGIAKGMCSVGIEYEVHCHEFIELVFIADGISTHYVDGKAFEVRRGDFLFINHNQSHSFKVDETIVYYNFFIRPEYISRKLADAHNIYDIFSFFIFDEYFEDCSVRVPLVSLSAKDVLSMEQFAEKMYFESENKMYGYELALDGYMKIIFSGLIRALHEKKSGEFRSSVTNRILEYIDANYTKPLTLTELADKCFYNPAYLGRLFKNTFNMSLRDYIAEKRLNYAKSLLTQTDDTIENISLCVGYSDKKQFYKMFKDKTGHTPKQY